MHIRQILGTVAIVVLAVGPAQAVDHVSFRFHGEEARLAGRLLIEDNETESLLQTPDGVLWAIGAGDLLDHDTDDAPFAPLTPEELSQDVLRDLPDGFEVYRTAHYIVCYDTSRAYAQWCGSLLERLYLAFTNYWSRQGFPLREPEFPLVAIVFADRAAYRAYARAELGDAVDSIVGYYSLRTNRVTMYDLTGIAGGQNKNKTTVAQINAALQRTDAQATVATVVHEATHQIAFNSGLQTRYADIPLWLCEGLAVYFESPDLKSSKGWRTMGEVNRPRLDQFRRYLPRRPSESLRTLIQDDVRLRDTGTGPEAYAEAWALVYYLMRNRRDDFQAYLRTLAEKPQLARDDAETRVREFVAHFGDLPTLDAEFLRQMKKVQ